MPCPLGRDVGADLHGLGTTLVEQHADLVRVLQRLLELLVGGPVRGLLHGELVTRLLERCAQAVEGLLCAGELVADERLLDLLAQFCDRGRVHRVDGRRLRAERHVGSLHVGLSGLLVQLLDLALVELAAGPRPDLLRDERPDAGQDRAC